MDDFIKKVGLVHLPQCFILAAGVVIAMERIIEKVRFKECI